MDARTASPKASAVAARPRELTGFPYVDEKSGCLAIGYTESGREYTALFKSVEDMSMLATEFNLGTKALALAELVISELKVNVSEEKFVQDMDEQIKESETELFSKTWELGFTEINDPAKDAHYLGKIIAESKLHVAQSIGQGKVVIYDLRSLDKAVKVGDQIAVKFNGVRGVVNTQEKAAAGVGR